MFGQTKPRDGFSFQLLAAARCEKVVLDSALTVTKSRPAEGRLRSLAICLHNVNDLMAHSSSASSVTSRKAPIVTPLRHDVEAESEGKKRAATSERVHCLTGSR